jgi:oligogalacturonide lyase
MKRRSFLISSAAIPLAYTSLAGATTAVPKTSIQKPVTTNGIPLEWVDETTGHKIRRLSDTDNTASLYFHDNGFTQDGRYMVMNSPEGVVLHDFKTGKNKLLIKGFYEVITVSATKNICYVRKLKEAGRGKGVNGLENFAVDIPSGKTRSLGVVEQGSIMSVNCDDTLLLGVYQTIPYELQPGPKVANTDGGYNAIGADGKPLSFAAAKEVRMADRLAQNIPMEIFTLNIKTGERKVVTASNDWLNHVQFSPTDPKRIMYCHEGPWHMVDRVWTINADGTGKEPVHVRTMNMEIAGHEFFSFDGKKIYYDLQTPRGEKFWLSSFDLETKQRVWYHLERNEWSVHFQISRDGKLFAGDGGDSEMVAHAPDGKYIYLFNPEIIEDLGASAPNAKDLIRPGRLASKKLVNMAKHDYRVEPNLQFTPDGKWLVFRSNMHGPIHTYAVAIDK